VLAKCAVGYLFTLIFQKAQLREILLVKKGDREDPSTLFAFKCFTTTSYSRASSKEATTAFKSYLYGRGAKEEEDPDDITGFSVNCAPRRGSRVDSSS
jgi:hypothetical protein